MKYIDAEKLKAEIERRIKELAHDKYISVGSRTARIAELHCIDRRIDSLQQEQPDVDLEQAAEEYAFGSLDDAALYGCTISGRFAAFKAGAEWQKKQFSDILDKWEEHATEGMRVGASAYHQGKIALICDLRDWMKEQTKKQ